MDAVALLLPEVRQTSVRRVRGREHPALGVGEGVLSVTKGEGEESSGGCSCACLQVDQNHLEMLADADEV